MKEKDLQTLFNKWCKKYATESAAYELKLARGNSLPFSSVQEHQVNALLVVSTGTLVHKIADCGYQNPFDSFVLSGAKAYVVIAFNGDIKKFVLIDIQTFIQEARSSHRKSLTMERAFELGQVVDVSNGCVGRVNA